MFDTLGVLDTWRRPSPWPALAIYSGPRYLHQQFNIVWEIPLPGTLENHNQSAWTILSKVGQLSDAVLQSFSNSLFQLDYLRS